MNDYAYTCQRIRDELLALPWPGLVGVPDPLAQVLTRIKRYKRRPSGTPQPRIEYELLVVLARTGWSMRWELLLAVNRNDIATRSGTFTRAFAQLQAAGLWEQRTARVGRWRVVLVRLTETGRDLLRAVGETPVLSEEEQIAAGHRGGASDAQLAHTAAICLFNFQARRRGWQALPTPRVADGRAEPDALITCGDHLIWVEVQRRGGDPWKRAFKWRNAAALQGYLALCATTPKLAQTLAAEARDAQVHRGLVTDLASLREAGPLWRCYWRSRDSTLISLADGEPLPEWTRSWGHRNRDRT